MNAPPFIGLTTSASVGAYPERAYTNAAYIDAVQGAGGVPVLLPPQLSGVARDALWSWLDALILTGGGDIDPVRYGQAPHPTVYEVSTARDDLELDLTRRALAEDVPLLAICRGIQVLNVALGGTLVQDIPSATGTLVQHSQKDRRHVATHAVKVEAGSRLAEVLGAVALEVNSLHHQSVDAPGDGVRVVAHAPDGIAEGIEVPGHPFAVAVQWHPEELVAHDAAARSLFRAVVDAASRRARRIGGRSPTPLEESWRRRL
jgi:putative glutamine amidotransferase